MACGTPVIAFNQGAIPELVEHGHTGFIVDDEDGAVAAAGRLHELSRAAIRRRFEQRFTARRMASDYVAVYRSLVEARQPRQKPAHTVRGNGHAPEEMAVARP
jgi:glycosyltransferase involved in cell wall biosynthesis